MTKTNGHSTRWYINAFRAADKFGIENIEEADFVRLTRLRAAGRTATHAALIIWGDPASNSSADAPRML